ncbi:MAG: AhpC/TSA family protein [Alphaproteobacteria bacterium]|nr:AhpC/TSA family protein [Alphaproteobacteria bacterium]
MTSKSLTETLADLRAKIGEPFKSLSDGVVRRLIDAQSTEHALKPGDKCPVFAMPSADGAIVTSADLLAKGPLVLSFYRGKWCPFCSAELEALHQASGEIRAAGAALAAVTAEVGGRAVEVKRERGFTFDILCDVDNGVALEFGIVFRVTPAMVETFSQRGPKFPEIYGNQSWFLPIPATYIVARDGTIAEAFVNPDFRYRLDPADIVRALRGVA